MLTNELLYCFGFYVAEGWSFYETNGKKSSSVSICQMINNKKMYDAAKELMKILSNAFNLDFSEYTDKKGCKSTTIYSKNLAYNFKKWFGEGVYNKHLPEWFNELNNEQQKSFLDGYIHGDGYTRNGVHETTSASKKLSSELAIIESGLGYGHTVEFSDEINTKITFNSNNDLKNKKIIVSDEYIHYPIKSLKISRPKRGEDRVYDLSVEDDHSFVVGNYNVHNCYRVGQQNDCNIYYMIFQDSVSEKVLNTLRSKRNMIEQIIDNNEDRDITEILMDEILEDVE